MTGMLSHIYDRVSTFLVPPGPGIFYNAMLQCFFSSVTCKSCLTLWKDLQNILCLDLIVFGILVQLLFFLMFKYQTM